MFPNYLFFISLLFSSFIFTHSYHNTQCLDHQKNLLLHLKSELLFISSLSTKLVQWNQTNNCCHWYGVECDGAGHVVSLQLDDEYISGGIGDSSSLFGLKYMEKLNLAYNEFYPCMIPKGIKHLKYLTHLNLSHAGFSGQVPLEISSLRRLVSLDISFHNFVSLELPNLEMLVQNLTGLRELYLDSVHITSSHERSNWSHIISSHLPNLTALSLSGCDLSGPLSRSFGKLHSLSVLRLDDNDLSTASPGLFTNFSSLTTLSLAYCGLKGSFPDKILRIPTLQHLDLSRNEQLSGSLPQFPHSRSLKSLSLSSTNLSGSIPSSIGNLKSLSEIDLSYCRFGGPIPSTFANLTQLTFVNLGENSFTGKIPNSLFGLPSLQTLYLQGNNFTGVIEEFPTINVSKIVTLDLRDNRLEGPIPDSFFQLQSLEELSLGGNLLNGSFQLEKIQSFANLTQLDLSGNNFSGVIEEFPTINVSKIVRLDLRDNRMEGPIPDSFFQFQSLEELYLSGNLFNGSFQLEKIQSFANLTQLDLSGNNLSVHVRNDNLTTYGLPMLYDLSLSSCNLHDFPDFIKHYPDRMESLDLSNNRISGEIPSWIWGKVTYLNISFNLLTHVQKPYNIPPSLNYLDLQSNQLRDELHLPITPNNTSHLSYLSLANNSLSGSIPTSLCSATGLSILDLSMNRLSGTIPSCLLDDTMTLWYLDLQSNQFRDELHLPIPPNNTSHLSYLSLANNSLSGSIPTSLCSATHLIALDLSMNQLSGTIPSCLLDGTMNLTVLDLGQNNFSGHIPDVFGLGCYLEYLNLNNNTLRGKIPKSIESCKELELMNVGNNLIDDTFPCMLSSSLRVLVLRSNRFHGEVKCHNTSWPELQIVDLSSNNFGGILKAVNFSSWRGMVLRSSAQTKHTELRYGTSQAGVRITMKGIEVEIVKIFPDFTTIDFSSNIFHGEIPKAIGDLSSLRLLNFSHNALNGSIPKSFGKLGELESLDLSQNQLTGHIPTELSRLTFLSVLNVSYNDLEGEIPKGRQLQTFPADSFLGNPGLCGFNLNISCIVHPDDGSDENEEEKKREIDWDYVSGALGYVVGLGGFVWVLIFCRSFRYRYFGKIEEVVEEMLDARERRRRRRRSDARRRRAVRDREVRRH